MSKASKRKRKRTRQGRAQRDYQYNTKRNELLRSPHYFVDAFERHEIIQDDKRRFTPTYQDRRRQDGRPVTYHVSRVAAVKRGRRRDFQERTAFTDPRKVPVCKRRKARRESLFSLGKIGRGIEVSRRRRRNKDSDVSCR